MLNFNLETSFCSTTQYLPRTMSYGSGVNAKVIEYMCPHTDDKRKQWISESQRNKINSMYEERQDTETKLISQMREY